MEQQKWEYKMLDPEQRGSLWYGCYLMITPTGVTQPQRRVIENGRETKDAARELAERFAEDERAELNGEPLPRRIPEAKVIGLHIGRKA